MSRLMPLNRHFVTAGSSLNATEMTLIQRIARLVPPLCNCCSLCYHCNTIFNH